MTKSNLTIRSQSGKPDETTVKSGNTTASVISIHADNVTISGIRAIGASGSGYSGIYLSGCNNCMIENNKLANNGRGIYLESSRKCIISNNIVTGNRVYGIIFASSSGNTISGNTAYNSSRGIYLGSSDYNTISGNNVTFNSYLGFFECSLCDYNIVYNNYFNNTNITVKSGIGNSYNTTKTAGTNIIGGSYIGGNYWGKPDGTGFSDKAVDKDGDGISDSPYNLPGDSTYMDYLPLAYPSSLSEPILPVADFSSNVTSGNAPLEVSFADKSMGTPTSWNWDFGDGTNSQVRNPVHVYPLPGNYTVNLTVNNENGTNSKTDMISVLEAEIENKMFPLSDFGTNATQGSAPLTIQFTDLSQNAVSWSWDFDNNGQPDSTVQNPVYVYENPGDYTVRLTVSNENGTNSKTLEIKVHETENKDLPVADFEINVTDGYAPLPVLFTDRSQNTVEIGWDFDNDGKADVNSNTVVYVYTFPGTYTVNLIATNANGTASKTATITALQESSSGGSSGGSSKSSGGSSGGGGGGSPEPARNVEVKELSQVFIANGRAVKFEFTKNATCVVYVGFDAVKNAGKTTTIVEQLKNKSALVSSLPDDEVYKSFNVWVGNSGYATSKNIEKPVVCFRINKNWIEDKAIDKNSVILNRYSNEKWEQLPAGLAGEDENYLYFITEVPGYGSFAITGQAVQQIKTESSEMPAEERSTGQIQPEKNEAQQAKPDKKGGNNVLLGTGIAVGILGIMGLMLRSMKK